MLNVCVKGVNDAATIVIYCPSNGPSPLYPKNYCRNTFYGLLTTIQPPII